MQLGMNSSPISKNYALKYQDLQMSLSISVLLTSMIN